MLALYWRIILLMAAALSFWHSIISLLFVKRNSFFVPAAYSCLWTTAGAFLSIRVPASDIPVTGQTLAVCLAALLFGRPAATAGAVLYYILAVSGAPILSGGRSGLSDASRGYVFGFTLCALITATEPSRGVVHVLGRSAIAQFACATIGTAWSLRRGLLSNTAALQIGVRPFLPGLVVKSLVVATLGALAQTSLYNKTAQF